MSIAEEFLASVEAFLSESGMSATVFGERAVNDRSFVFDLREGRNVSLQLVERVQAFMAENRPARRRPARKRRRAA